MGQVRWFDRAGPPSVMFATALMLAVAFPSAIRAVPPDKLNHNSACDAFDVSAVAHGTARTSLAQNGVTSRIVLDSEGVVTGRRLEVPAVGGPTRPAISLAPESFVAPVVGSILVYGQHTSRDGSLIRALDVETGCDVLVARSEHIVRSAILNPTGTALYVHAVTSRSRADAGVVRHDLASGAIARVVEPLPVDETYGPTFGTELRWSEDATALAVQSCGLSRCRTRLLQVATGDVETYAGAGHGSLVGVTQTHLVVYDRCHWLPCGVLSIDLSTGAVGTLAEEALSAQLLRRDGRDVVVLETTAGTQEVAP